MQETNRKHYTQQDKEIMYQIANLFLKDIDEAFDHMYKINDQLEKELEYTVHYNDKTFFNSTFTTPYEAIYAIGDVEYGAYEPWAEYLMYHNHGGIQTFCRDCIHDLMRADMISIVELILHSVDKVDFNFKPDIVELIDQLSTAFPRRQTN